MGTPRLAIALFLGLVSGAAQQTSVTRPQGLTPPSPATPGDETLSPEKRGDIMMARRAYRDAIEVYLQAPKNEATVLNKIGIAYHQIAQFDQAKKYYERAIKARRNYAEAYNNLGAVHYTNKSYRKAISNYKKALAINPNSASFHMNLGTAYFARKKDADAVKEYQTALALDPEVFEHRGNYGTVLEQRNTEERGKFYYTMAKLYAKSTREDRNEIALRYLRRALEEGFKGKDKIAEEPDFAGLRELPEFKELLAHEPRVL